MQIYIILYYKKSYIILLDIPYTDHLDSREKLVKNYE